MVILKKMAIFSELWKVDLGPFGNKLFIYRLINGKIVKSSVDQLISQTFKGDPRTCAVCIPAWGSNWGYLGFSHDQNNCDSSGAYVLRSEREGKHA